MNNMPELKIGVVAVSRDCFPESLSVTRRANLMKAYTEKYGEEGIYECPICIVESEIHMVQALEDIKAAGCNALVVYLGNFGPEISETLLAKHFEGPKMFIAAYGSRSGHFQQPSRTVSGGIRIPTCPQNLQPKICPASKMCKDKSDL